jgi:hypothetical protein
VEPVPDPLLLRKTGGAENRIRASGSVARNSDHYNEEGSHQRLLNSDTDFAYCSICRVDCKFAKKKIILEYSFQDTNITLCLVSKANSVKATPM